MSNESNSLLGNEKKPIKVVPYALIAAAIAVIAVGAFFLFRDTEPPVLAIGPDLQYISFGTELTVTAKDPGTGIKHLKLTATDGKKTITLIDKVLPPRTVVFIEKVKLPEGKLQQGKITLAFSAQDNSIYPFGASGASSTSKSYTLDVTPPSISILTPITNLNQGGSGIIAFALSEKAAKTGIRVGDRFFPAYFQEGQPAPNTYYCMFTIPWDTPPSEFKPIVEASDAAGNTAKRGFNFHANARKFRKDKIRLSTSFMERVLPQFAATFPTSGSLIEQYIKVNNELRRKNAETILAIGQRSSPTMLWSGKFARMRNAANRARFADNRDYMFEGKIRDNQTHLGLDLASVRHAKIPAGNNGIVVFADTLGIYGKCIIVDHGLGLMTLYSHLSSIAVQKGQQVNKGDTLGRTGVTGLAGGDHLHYGVYISGIPVQPIEWWDATWIKNNITSKLN